MCFDCVTNTKLVKQWLYEHCSSVGHTALSTCLTGMFRFGGSTQHPRVFLSSTYFYLTFYIHHAFLTYEVLI